MFSLHPMAFDPQPILHGDLLTLRPLERSDYEALFAVASDPLIWEQHPVPNRHEPSVFVRFFEDAIRSGGTLVALDNDTRTIIGSSRYHAYDEIRSEVEIGWTFLTRTHWGGKYNGEMKRMMIDHAFKYVDSLIFLVGPNNIRSQRAVEKIGGKRDGTRADGSGLKSYLYRIERSG